MDGWINALAVYNGELIAGGQFVNAGGVTVNNIARWDGTTWTDVSGGTNSIVAALTVYNGQLIAGGYFTDAEGVPCNYIGAWDQNGWYTLGTGMNSQVMALNVYGNDLIAAGFFTTADGLTADHIAKWNGTSWSALGSGIAWITYSLGTYNGDLIAGGLFSTAGGISANSIAKWNGTSWAPLGSGMGATPVGYDYVFALAEYNGSLFAGGMYETADGITANSIAKWDGTSWTDLNGGVQYGGSNVFAVNALTVYNNDLYASGIFSTAGSEGVAHIAKWHEVPTGINKNESVSFFGINPNPVSRTALVTYTLYKAENVKLVLMDVTGRIASEILDELKLPGNYSIELNTTELSKGMYFLKLNTAGRSTCLNVLKD
jgi:hypothetical protein